MKVTITATGLPKAFETLDRRSGPQLDRSVGRASQIALRAIKPGVQAAVPVRTGRARRSVRVGRARRDARPGGYIGFAKGLVYRGPLVKRTGVIVRAASAQAGLLFATFRAALAAELESRR